MYICAKCKARFNAKDPKIEYLDRCMCCATEKEIKERIDLAMNNQDN